MITEEQRLARNKSIGGSDAAAVAGFSKWKTPYQVWREKLFKEKPIFSDEQKERMDWGNIHETSIIDRYEEVTGETVTRDIETIKHTNHKFITANLDGFIEKSSIVLEAKTATRKEGWGRPGTDNMPVEYLFQVAHYCMLTDAEQAHVAVLFNGSEFKIYVYNRRKDLEKLLIARYVNFWTNNIEKGIEPELITIEDVSLKYKSADGASKIADDEAIQNHMRLKELNYTIKQLNDEKKELKFEQKKKMGHATQLTDAYGVPLHTWEQHTKNQFSQEYIKKNYPDAYKCALTEEKYRTFLIK